MPTKNAYGIIGGPEKSPAGKTKRGLEVGQPVKITGEQKLMGSNPIGGYTLRGKVGTHGGFTFYCGNEDFTLTPTLHKGQLFEFTMTGLNLEAEQIGMLSPDWTVIATPIKKGETNA